jgi:hypothetical protein
MKINNYLKASSLLEKWKNEKSDYDNEVYPILEKNIRSSYFLDVEKTGQIIDIMG